jgi:ribonuclease BN (tRNA processing enzyme)
MSDQLIVRVYNVGFGDCIFVKVPQEYEDGTGTTQTEARCMLIDCGSSDLPEGHVGPKGHALKDALHDVVEALPERMIEGQNRRVLDLLVLTHKHKDHMSGLVPDSLDPMWIERVWLSPLLYKKHKQAKGFRALQALNYRATMSLLERGFALTPQLRELWMMRMKNDDIEKNLKALPGKHNSGPLYVWRDLADQSKTEERLDAEEWLRLQPQLQELQFDEHTTTCAQMFREPGTSLRVLAPEWDIDGHYLNKGDEHYPALLASYAGDLDVDTQPIDYDRLLQMDERNREEAAAPRPAPAESERPNNISSADFRTLQDRLAYSALRFTAKEEGIKNNTSVVLLLEWRKRRLLFAGDLQWKEPSFLGKKIGGWDVMLDSEGASHLESPLDFFKVSHHGSENGTPYLEEGKAELEELGLLKEGGDTTIVLSVPHPSELISPSTGHRKLKWRPELIEWLEERGQVLRTYEPNDRTHPADHKFAIQVAFEAAPGWNP